jgi:membrane associated rhomboid family serine protease
MFLFFPFRDVNRSRALPYVSWIIIGLCVAVHGYVMFLTSNTQDFFRTHGFAPVLFSKLALPAVIKHKPIILLSPITYMFVHGGLIHLISNMWAFWIYSDNVEERMGHVRFLFFYIICGLVAVATHYVTHRGDVTPVVGASGALAGVMAAYLRLFPMARIQCLLWFIIIIRIIEVPAMAVIVLWFVSQLMSILGDSVGNVAWYAHIGGFVTGSWLTTRWFPRQSFRFMRW